MKFKCLRQYITYYSILSFLFYACDTDHQYMSELRQIDSLIYSDPQQALTLLQQISLDSLSSKEENAYYGLLLSHASDRNERNLLPCDSLLNLAIDYYRKGFNKGRSLFYKARLLTAMGMEDEAMGYYFGSLKEFGHTPREIRFKGMVYEDLGNIYFDQAIYKEALEKYTTALKYYSIINDKKAMIYASSMASSVCLVDSDNKKAHHFLNMEMQLAKEINDSCYISNTLQHASVFYESTDKPDSALYYAKKALSFTTDNTNTSKWLSSIGRIYLEKEQTDSARHYLEASLNTKDVEALAISHASLAEIEKDRHNYKSAYNHLEQYTDVIDSIAAADKSSEIQKLGYQHEAEVKIAKHKGEMQLSNALIITAAIIAILILIVILQQISKRKKTAQLRYERKINSMNQDMKILQTRITQNETMLTYLRKEQESYTAEIQNKEQEIKDLYQQREEVQHAFFRQSAIYKKINKLAKQDTADKKKINVLNLSDQESLRDTIFAIYNDSITELRLQHPRLTDEDIIFLCLEKNNLPSSIIAYCFGSTNTQVINQRRYRLKERMAN